jgi:hypothetical protein
MAFEAEKIKGIIENAESSTDDKLKLITSEHEADKRALVQNRDSILGEKDELQKKLKEAEVKAAETAERITQLEEEVKKNSPEDIRKVYDAKIEAETKKRDTEIEKLKVEIAGLEESHHQRLFADEITNGVKDISFVNDAYKKSFINNIRSEHVFEHKVIDGKDVFINKDGKTFADVAQEYKLSAEGQNFIANGNTGGGASGSQTRTSATTAENPFVKETLNLDEQGRLLREQPALAATLKAQAGVA